VKGPSRRHFVDIFISTLFWLSAGGNFADFSPHRQYYYYYYYYYKQWSDASFATDVVA